MGGVWMIAPLKCLRAFVSSVLEGAGWLVEAGWLVGGGGFWLVVFGLTGFEGWLVAFGLSPLWLFEGEVGLSVGGGGFWLVAFGLTALEGGLVAFGLSALWLPPLWLTAFKLWLTAFWLVPIGLPVGSPLWVAMPHLMVNVYCLGASSSQRMVLVASPKAMGSNPSAKGSRVPQCPTRLTPSNRLRVLVTPKEGMPAGLLISSQPLVASSWFAIGYSATIC